MSTPPKTVLVTGARGFIGRPLAEAIAARGHRVVGLSRHAQDGLSFECAQGDVLDRARMQAVLADVRPDTLVHAAWMTEHGVYWRHPANFDWVKASLDLAQDFHAAGGRDLAVVGTCMEYAINDLELCHATQTPTGPEHLYGVAKDALRRLLTRYCADAGLRFLWPRLFLLFGPQENPHRLVPSIARAILRGEEAKSSSGRQRRDFIHTADAGRALALALDSDLSGPINVASGVDVTIADIVTTIGAALDRPDLVRLGALPDRPGEPPRLVADIADLSVLGFAVTREEVLERLRQTVRAVADHATATGAA